MDMKSIDLNLLVALEALLAERNVSRAAVRLGLSQSATSAQLARLREVFRDPLLVRTPRGMLPTARAAALAEPLRQVLGEIGRMVQPSESFDAAAATVTFSIAASDYVEYALLPRLVDHLEAHASRARIAIRPTHYRALRQQLESGEVDLAILSRQNLGEPGPDVRSRPLYSERFVCVARRDHPLLKGREVTLDQFCAIDHVFTSPAGGGFVGQADQALAAVGRSRNVRLSVPHFLLAPEIVARSDMIAVLPERLAAGYADRLRVLQIPLELAGFTIVQAWHERVHRDPAQGWLRQVVSDLTADWTEADRAPLPPARRLPQVRR